jgi:large subunit ribosomal protein L24
MAAKQGKLRLKKNDIIIVRSGKDKGKTGKVLVVFPEKNRVIVERINFLKQFIRPDRSKNVQGGIMEKEAPIQISNLMLYCSECEKGVRIKHKVLEDASKVRVCAKCDTSLEKT